MKVLLKYIFILFLFAVLSSCSLLIRNSSNNRITTSGNYKIESQTEGNNIENGKSKIKGFVFDDYSKDVVSYGYVVVGGDTTQRVLIDSVGCFEMLLPYGPYRLKISSVGNRDLTTDIITLKNRYITLIKVYLGADVMYEKEK